MTKKQFVIEKYLKSQNPDAKYEFAGDDRVVLLCENGIGRILETNQHNDILDAETGEVIAISDLTYDEELVSSYIIPSVWENVMFG